MPLQMHANGFWYLFLISADLNLRISLVVVIQINARMMDAALTCVSRHGMGGPCVLSAFIMHLCDSFEGPYIYL